MVHAGEPMGAPHARNLRQAVGKVAKSGTRAYGDQPERGHCYSGTCVHAIEEENQPNHGSERDGEKCDS